MAHLPLWKQGFFSLFHFGLLQSKPQKTVGELIANTQKILGCYECLCPIKSLIHNNYQTRPLIYLSQRKSNRTEIPLQCIHCNRCIGFAIRSKIGLPDKKEKIC